MSEDEVLHFGQIQRLARGRHGREYLVLREIVSKNVCR